MQTFQGRHAVITGAGSGFGLELARLAAGAGMNVVLMDVQPNALDTATTEIQALCAAKGRQAFSIRADVSDAAAMDAAGATVMQRLGAPHLVFNNAGVGAGGLIWENTVADWNWVMGVNVMGVVHGVRVFTPLMLAAAKADPSFEGHIVNTASMAGLLNPPMMGIYNASKHAVVSISESLYHDLSLVTQQISASVLCPYFVATGIHQSHRNRPDREAKQQVTLSQRVAQAQSDKAVTSGKISAQAVAQMVMDAVRDRQFYIYSHPKALKTVQTRLEDVVGQRNPTDPFVDKPEVGQWLREALKGEGQA